MAYKRIFAVEWPRNVIGCQVARVSEPKCWTRHRTTALDSMADCELLAVQYVEEREDGALSSLVSYTRANWHDGKHVIPFGVNLDADKQLVADWIVATSVKASGANMLS